MYGRGRELAQLRDRVKTPSGSVTVLAGETRIGKSTLLKEFVRELNGGIEAFAGSYECAYRETRDPLLPCVNNLAAAVVSDPYVLSKEVLRDVFGTRSSDWLEMVLQVGKAAPYIGRVVEAGAAVVRTVRDARERLERRTQLEVPLLDAEMFRELIEMLRILAGARQLVLVLDNFSAVPEQNWSALLTFVHPSDRQDGVHFVLGWKQEHDTAAALVRLETQIRPYGGATQRLEVLAEDDATAWLSEAPWFGALPRKEQHETLLATGLFPELIHDVATASEVPPISKIARMKDDYVLQTYADLEALIRSDHPIEFLFQLLSGAAKSPPDLVARLGSYAAALRGEGGDLETVAPGSDDRLLHFLLAPALASAPLPDIDPSSAHQRLNLAKGLANASSDYGSEWRWDELDGVLALLRIIVRDFPRDESIHEPVAVALANAVGAYGRAWQWDAVRSVLTELDTLAHDAPQDSTVHRQLAIGLANAGSCYGADAHWADLNIVNSRLRALTRDFSEDDVIRQRLAMSLATASGAYGRSDHWDDLADVLAELQALARDFSMDETIREQLAMTLVNAGSAYAPGERWHDLNMVLQQLRALARAFPEDHAVREQLARGLIKARDAYGSRSRREESEGVLSELRTLASDFPHDNVLQQLLTNNRSAYGKQ